MTTLRIPKIQMAIALSLVFVAATIHSSSYKPLGILIFSLFATIGSDFIFNRIRKTSFIFPSAAIVSAFIITLLASPALPTYQLFIVGIIAMFFKNFLRISNRHIFNPAAIGLLLGSLIFGNAVSWWGVSFQQLTINNLQLTIGFFILLSPFLVSAVRMRRYRIILGFLIFYAIGSIVLSSAHILNAKYLILNTLLDPTIIFFTAVMLPEPMTSPNRNVKQITFGIFVAALALILSHPILNSKFLILTSIDSFIFSLLLGNLIFFKLK